MGIHFDSSRVLGAHFFIFKLKLAWSSCHPLMPFKFHYHVEHIVIEFTNIVVALRLIAAVVLWFWLYAIAQLLSHYNGPLYFERV